MAKQLSILDDFGDFEGFDDEVLDLEDNDIEEKEVPKVEKPEVPVLNDKPSKKEGKKISYNELKSINTEFDDISLEIPEEKEETEEGTQNILQLLGESVFEEMGLEWDNSMVSSEDPKELVNVLLDVINTNSKNNFSSEEVKYFNDYVANGGKPENFFKEVYGEDSNLDPEDPNDYDRIYFKYFKETTTHSDDRIYKHIKKLKTVEGYEEEVKDIYKSLQEIYQEKQKKIVLEQDNQRKKQLEEFEQTLNNTRNYILNAKQEDLAGYDLTEQEKKKFIDYYTGFDKSTGKTKFHDFIADPNNVMRLALLAFKGATDGKLEKKAEQKAISKLRDKLSKVSDSNSFLSKNSSKY